MKVGFLFENTYPHYMGNFITEFFIITEFNRLQSEISLFLPTLGVTFCSLEDDSVDN